MHARRLDFVCLILVSCCSFPQQERFLERIETNGSRGVSRGLAMHTGLTPTRISYRDSCWQFGCQALTGLGWLRNHVKVMGEREILNKSYKFS